MDLIYSHSAELIFNEPVFFRGPFSWSTSPDKKPVIELLNKSRTLRVATDCLIELPNFIFSLTNEDELEILIACKDINVEFETVFYYRRNNLGENKQLAYWLTA